jgi:Zn-dependent protease
MADPISALAFYIVFLFSVTFHEAAHAWLAKRGGDPTAYLGGQVSLNPLPHIRREPFGMVVIPLISVAVSGWPFGFASAPYDPTWASRHPRRAAWMALAGPLANLAIVLTAAFLIHLGMAAGAFQQPPAVNIARVTVSAGSELWTSAALLLSIFFSMNLILFLLNMIPLPPLDGSGAVKLILPESIMAKYEAFLRTPMLGWLGILIAWRVFGAVFPPLFLLAVNLLYPGAHYG